MHMSIIQLVYANSPDEAVEKAESIAEGYCGDGKDFDYYSVQDLEGGKDVHLATSDAGKILIDDCWGYTRQDFLENMAKIRAAMVFTDEEIMEGKLADILVTPEEMTRPVNPRRAGYTLAPEDHGKAIILDQARYAMHCAGSYRGGEVHIYDNDGEGIRTTRHLNNALDKWKTLDTPGKPGKYDGLDVYAVHLDVHF